MASAHVIPFQLTGSGFAEALGGTSFGFHFWHRFPSFYPPLLLVSRVFFAKE